MTDCSSTSGGDVFSPSASSLGNSLSPVSVGVTSELHMKCAHDPIPITHETRQNQNPFSDGNSTVADMCLQSPSSSFVSNSPSSSYHGDGQPNYRGISPYSPGDGSDVFSGVSDTTGCSPGLLSASGNQAVQFAANSPELLSSSNSPGMLSSAASLGMSPTNSPQSVTNSPALLSAANSPEQLAATGSPGLLSTASDSSFSSPNGAAQHQPNYYHDNNGAYYWEMIPGETGVGPTAHQSNYMPMNTGPGLLSYANGPGLQQPICTIMPPHSLSSQLQQAPCPTPNLSVPFSASHGIAMVTAPLSVHMRVPSSTPSTVNGTSDLQYDRDFNQLLSELDAIPFKA